jgi:hypothetical protein
MVVSLRCAVWPAVLTFVLFSTSSPVICAQSLPASNGTGAPGTVNKQLSSTAPATPALETPWDARKIIAKVVTNAQQLTPLLQKIDPQSWVQKGAPGAYILQWQTCQGQLRDVQTVANRLSQSPENLPKVLDLYFRLESLELTVRSIGEGAQTYDDRTVASQVLRLAGSSFDSRQRLREYLTDLAESNEANCEIADEEAQRCRGMISREPAAAPTKKHK